MKTVVLGSGGWGTALSQILCDNGHETYLWSHSPAKAAEMARTRENPLLQGVHLPESLHITGDLDCLKGADLVELQVHLQRAVEEPRPGGQRTALLRRAGDSKKNGPVSHGEDCGGVRFQGD